MFDTIIIGLGSMGSSACYHLAERGQKVLGIEQFEISHDLGAHGGQSRIIRKAYFEHPDYVPLLDVAYRNWKQLEKLTGEQLYWKTGVAYFGNPDHIIMKGVKQSSSLYDIPLEEMDAPAAMKKFPVFKLPHNYCGYYEPEAGFVTPAKTIRLYCQLAIDKGATIQTNEKVLTWEMEEKRIKVITTKNVYYSQKLVITAGPWAAKMIPGMSEQLRITRQFVSWIEPKTREKFQLNNFPCWMIADDDKPGAFYGFPILPVNEFGEPDGLKLAYHYPGKLTDPDNVDRETSTEDFQPLQYALQKYLPGTFDSVLSTKTCLYANSPDDNFIVDKLPGFEENVVIGCGFSGHGFKFVPVIGEILADLVIEGQTKLPIGFLSSKRLKLPDIELRFLH